MLFRTLMALGDERLLNACCSGHCVPGQIQDCRRQREMEAEVWARVMIRLTSSSWRGPIPPFSLPAMIAR
jgi:hypothetical protein